MLGPIFNRFSALPCIRHAGGVLSFREVLTLGRSLISEIRQERALVLLRCTTSPETIAAYVALLIDGHVPLLVEANLRYEALEQLCSRYRPNVLLEPDLCRTRQLHRKPVVLHEKLCLLLSTSGSTGSPKLVRLGSAGQIANAHAIADYLGIGPTERSLVHLPLSYSYGLSIVHSHLVSGATLCPTSHSMMEANFWDDLRRYECTSLAGVPFHYSMMRRLGEARLDISSLTTLTVAGGRLDPALTAHFARWADRTGRRFFAMYGQTEAGPRIAYLPHNRAADAPDALGIAIPGVTISLEAEDGRPVPTGEIGEIVVRGPGVMHGYAQDQSDLSKGDELGGLLRTGDLAHAGADGLYRLAGRSSLLLKLYGLRVNLADLDEELAAAGYEANCFGEDDSLCILVSGESDPDEVRRRLVKRFAIPPRAIEVRAGPAPTRSSSGKLSLEALRQAWQVAGEPV